MNFKITTEFKNVDEEFIKKWFTELSYCDNPELYKHLLISGKVVEHGFGSKDPSDEMIGATKTYEITEES